MLNRRGVFLALALVPGLSCRDFLLGGLLAGLLGTGCGPSVPETSPVVTIKSPVNNMPFPSGVPIVVSFQIGGFDMDPATGKNVPFTLDPLGNQTRETGKGRVVATYNNSSNILAVAANPADLTIRVPDPMYGSPASIITEGSGVIQLSLQYGDETFVFPQRSAQVTVSIYKKP